MNKPLSFFAGCFALLLSTPAFATTICGQLSFHNKKCATSFTRMEVSATAAHNGQVYRTRRGVDSNGEFCLDLADVPLGRSVRLEVFSNGRSFDVADTRQLDVVTNEVPMLRHPIILCLPADQQQARMVVDLQRKEFDRLLADAVNRQATMNQQQWSVFVDSMNIQMDRYEYMLRNIAQELADNKGKVDSIRERVMDLLAHDSIATAIAVLNADELVKKYLKEKSPSERERIVDLLGIKAKLLAISGRAQEGRDLLYESEREGVKDFLLDVEIARLESVLGNWRGAEAWCIKALSKAHSQEAKDRESAVHVSLAFLALIKHDYVLAMAHADSSLTMYSDLSLLYEEEYDDELTAIYGLTMALYALQGKAMLATRGAADVWHKVAGRSATMKSLMRFNRMSTLAMNGEHKKLDDSLTVWLPLTRALYEEGSLITGLRLAHMYSMKCMTSGRTAYLDSALMILADSATMGHIAVRPLGMEDSFGLIGGASLETAETLLGTYYMVLFTSRILVGSIGRPAHIDQWNTCAEWLMTKYRRAVDVWGTAYITTYTDLLNMVAIAQACGGRYAEAYRSLDEADAWCSARNWYGDEANRELLTTVGYTARASVALMEYIDHGEPAAQVKAQEQVSLAKQAWKRFRNRVIRLNQIQELVGKQIQVMRRRVRAPRSRLVKTCS